LNVLSFNPEAINWGTDWWKLLIIAFSVLLLAYLCIRLALYVLRMIGVVVCLAVGVLGGYVAQIFNGALAERVPEEMGRFANVATGLAGFVICYGIAVLVMMLIRKPAQPMQQPKEKS